MSERRAQLIVRRLSPHVVAVQARRQLNPELAAREKVQDVLRELGG